MTNFLISLVIAISLSTLTALGALELFQSARDNYDQQMVWLRLQQTAAAIKSNIRIVDGLPTVPMATITGTYPTVPTWVTANARDTNGNAFAYCPYALRPTTNLEGSSGTVTGPGYSVITYSSSLFGAQSPSYVIGSSKPNLYSTSPNATLTPGATTGYGVTFTASTGVFSASHVGLMLTSGGSSALITGYTSTTQVTATVNQKFPSTSAIASGSWKLSSVTPQGLLGLLITFKPHDTFNATTAANWCNGNIQVFSSGKYVTNASASTSPAGIVYPILVGQSGYQQAAVKSDNVNFYVATAATGDGTGRNPSNQTTLSAALAQLNALMPMRATIYVATGTHTATPTYTFGSDNANLRRMTWTFVGTGSPTLNMNFNTYVNLVFKNLTVSSSSQMQVNAATQMILDGATASATNVYVLGGTLRTKGTSTVGYLYISKNGHVFINGTTSIPGAYLIGGDLNVLPSATLTVTKTVNADAGVWVYGGGRLNVSGTLNVTTPGGTQMRNALSVESGGFANFNNATFSVQSGTSTVAGDTLYKAASLISGEMNINNTSILFPNGASSGVAAVYLIYGGRFTMHNNSVIGSSGTAAQRPYYAVYDGGGLSVGGSSTGYTSGANGEGGDQQSNAYVNNTAGALCWDGTPLPAVPASGSTQQQRYLFLDSKDGTNTYTYAVGGATSTPSNNNTSESRQVNANTWSTFLNATSPSIGTGTKTFTIPASVTGQAGNPPGVGDQVVIVSNSDVSNYMAGYVISYSGTTLTARITATGGSGTIATGSATTRNVAGGLSLRHLALANQSDWKCTNPNSVTTLKSFNFAPTVWCSTPSPAISETLLPVGANTTQAISITSHPNGGSAQYSLDAGATWTSSAGTIGPGRTLTLRLTPPATNGITLSPTVTIGGVGYTPWTFSVNGGCYAINPISGNQVTANGGGVSSLTLTLGSGSTANNMIFVTVGHFNFPTRTVTVTDNKGSTYTAINNTSNGNSRLYTFFAKQVASGVTTITVTFSGSVTNGAAIATEYPIANSNPLDQQSMATGSSTSATPTQSGELIVGSTLSYATGGSPTITGAIPSSNLVTAVNGNLRVGQSDTNTTATTSQTASYTLGGGGVVSGVTGIATFVSP